MLQVKRKSKEKSERHESKKKSAKRQRSPTQAAQTTHSPQSSSEIPLQDDGQEVQSSKELTKISKPTDLALKDSSEIVQIVPDENCNTASVLSRDISIENQTPIETQIENGIMNLLEQEISGTDKKQYPPRPQSLSFYEDELLNDDMELSGQLQAQSPPERLVQPEHGERRKNFFVNANTEIDNKTAKTFDRVYRKSGHKSDGVKASGGLRSVHYPTMDDSDTSSLGTSREQIVSDKKHRKHKRYRRSQDDEYTRRANKINQSFFNEGYQPQTEILMALDDLQDDVFEGPAQIHNYTSYGDSPKSTNYIHIIPNLPLSNKVYVEKKNHYEARLREQLYGSNDANPNFGGQKSVAFSDDITPLDVSICFQMCWITMSTFCHGLLAGLALAHVAILGSSQYDVTNELFVSQFIEFSEFYASAFFILCVICVISVFDRFDISHMNFSFMYDLWTNRKSFLVIFVYLTTLVLTLTNVEVDSSFRSYNAVVNKNQTGLSQEIQSKLVIWSRISLARSISAILGWMVISFTNESDSLTVHLKDMLKYESRA